MANKRNIKPLTQRMSIYEQEYKLKEQAKEILKKIKETLEEAAERFTNTTRLKNPKSLFCEGAKWQAERICDSEVIQRIRASKSDAEARRIIRTI
jgi:hypothetical protein